jgi:hypothetical protein
MMDLATIRAVNARAMREASRAHVEPATFTGNRENFRCPYVGDRTPRGWRKTKREPLFVDISGFGTDDEAAMSYRQFLDALEVGKAYGLIECGQFQGYVQEFERISA